MSVMLGIGSRCMIDWPNKARIASTASSSMGGGSYNAIMNNGARKWIHYTQEDRHWTLIGCTQPASVGYGVRRGYLPSSVSGQGRGRVGIWKVAGGSERGQLISKQ